MYEETIAGHQRTVPTMRPLRYQDLTPYGRALYILCALVILSYILFDVLDVDGSDFAKVFNSSHKSSIGVFIHAEAEFDFAAKHDAPRLGTLFVVGSLIVLCAERWISAAPSNPLNRARAHGSLLAFARNSLPDSSPDH